MFPVLHNQYFTCALRVDIFSKLVKDFKKRIKSDLLRVGKIRNLYAHISPNYFDGGEEITAEMLGWYPNPDKQEERLDFKKIFEEFFKLRDIILPYLNDECKKIGLFSEDKSENKKSENIKKQNT